jgi:hypothetical protein
LSQQVPRDGVPTAALSDATQTQHAMGITSHHDAHWSGRPAHHRQAEDAYSAWQSSRFSWTRSQASGARIFLLPVWCPSSSPSQCASHCENSPSDSWYAL